MHVNDIFGPMLMINSIRDITGNKLYDTVLIIIVSLVYFFIDINLLKKRITEKFNYLFITKYNEIKFVGKKDKWPIALKSLLWYITKNQNNDISKVEHFADYRWDKFDNRVERENVFIICQSEEFKIYDSIYGKMSKETVEDCRNSNHTSYKDLYILRIFSEEKTINEIQEFVDKMIKQYKIYTKEKTLENQTLLSISCDKDGHLMIEKSSFDSTATFENSYIPNHDEIIGEIDNFLNNKEWYKKMGIPYNLGIILYGEPGCGKTRFIKQLLNYTGRHGIDIKLNDDFCFNSLKNLLHNENINDDYIIPQNKRIIIFEDIDAMCTILKDRDLIENETQKMIGNISDKKSKNSSNTSDLEIISLKKKNELNNNNLSYFLNIIDGLNECSGRIIVMTTNKINYLDKAIIRPGRIDLKINFTKYSKEDVRGIINKFWKKSIKIEQIRDDVDNKYTSAEIINIFRNSNDFKDVREYFLK